MAYSLRSNNPAYDVPMHTDIQVIFDKSFSMTSFGNSTRDQLYNLVQDQIKLSEENGQDINISIQGFNDYSVTYVDNKPILSLKTITKKDIGRWVFPDGMTRFNDTIIECAQAQEKRITEYNKKLPSMVRNLSPKINEMMYIITDGFNNRGERTVEEVHSVITSARKRGVICILLAANRDATELAKECGMDEKIAMTMGNDPHTTELAMGFTNTMVRAISSGESQADTLEFSPYQRSVSNPQDTYHSGYTGIEPLTYIPDITADVSDDDTIDENDELSPLPPPPPFQNGHRLTRQ